MVQFIAESTYSRERDLSVDIYQHPASGASSICPTYYECVINFLKDGDEIVALHLLEKKKTWQNKVRKTLERDAKGKRVYLHFSEGLRIKVKGIKTENGEMGIKGTREQNERQQEF